MIRGRCFIRKNSAATIIQIVLAIGLAVEAGNAASKSWHLKNPDVPASIHSLAVDPTAPKTIYAGTEEGVFKSTDGGAGWRRTSLATFRVYVLLIDPSNPQEIIAGGLGGIFRSVDGGENWMDLNGPG